MVAPAAAADPQSPCGTGRTSGETAWLQWLFASRRHAEHSRFAAITTFISAWYERPIRPYCNRKMRVFETQQRSILCSNKTEGEKRKLSSEEI
jgi:hypothetical protein